jgi:hypothetical protein
MTTLRVWQDGHYMMAEAIYGPVNNLVVDIGGEGVNVQHGPEELSPADGAIVVAVRTRSNGGDPNRSTVHVSWLADTEPNSTTVEWT